MTDVVLALDISLSACGMVAIPLDWAGEWASVAKLEIGDSIPRDAPEEVRIGRLHRIAAPVVAFAQRHLATIVVAEGYAFGAKFERERLGEIHGAIKYALATQAGRVVERLIPPHVARKLMLGAVPKSDPKRAVRDHLRARGMPLDWTEGVVDAFAIGNVILKERGAAAFAAPTPAPQRRRKAA